MVNGVSMHERQFAGYGHLFKWLGWSIAVILLDQISKYIATQYLVLNESLSLMPMVNLTLAHNSGAAFSFLSSASGWQRWFFIVLALCISVAIMVWLSRLTADEKYLALSLSLILGGAIGNVWDRVQFGYVIDFIDVYYDKWHWPVFNIADSAITLGAVILIADSLILRKQKRTG